MAKLSTCRVDRAPMVLGRVPLRALEGSEMPVTRFPSAQEMPTHDVHMSVKLPPLDPYSASHCHETKPSCAVPPSAVHRSRNAPSWAECVGAAVEGRAVGAVGSAVGNAEGSAEGSAVGGAEGAEGNAVGAGDGGALGGLMHHT